MPTEADESPPGFQPVEIRLFDPARHDRTGFDCGVARLNNFLQLTARKQQQADISRVYVAVRPGDPRVLGYHAMNAYSLTADNLGPLRPKATPPHNTLPAIYLSMIAVSTGQQGGGLGSILLDHAKQKALTVADSIGAHAMVLDVLDDDGQAAAALRVAWYGKHGFQVFPGAPLKMFLPIQSIRETYPALDVPGMQDAPAR